jgi:hypothetical protein
LPNCSNKGDCSSSMCSAANRGLTIGPRLTLQKSELRQHKAPGGPAKISMVFTVHCERVAKFSASYGELLGAAAALFVHTSKMYYY